MKTINLSLPRACSDPFKVRQLPPPRPPLPPPQHLQQPISPKKAEVWVWSVPGRLKPRLLHAPKNARRFAQCQPCRHMWTYGWTDVWTDLYSRDTEERGRNPNSFQMRPELRENRRSSPQAPGSPPASRPEPRAVFSRAPALRGPPAAGTVFLCVMPCGEGQAGFPGTKFELNPLLQTPESQRLLDNRGNFSLT